MQHFQPHPASTFVCGADAVGRRNSRLDPDPTATTCDKCRNTPQWRWNADGERGNDAAKEAREKQIDRFAAARALTSGIPDSQYVAFVEGKVRMGLSTYEALAKAAAKPDLTAEEYNMAMEALMARIATAPRGMDTTLLATANSIKDKFGASTRRRAEATRDPKAEVDALYGNHGRQGVRPEPDDQSSPAETPVVHHYTPGWFETTCGLRYKDGKVMDSRWDRVTCSDCMSHYTPESDPLAPQPEGPLVHYYNETTDWRSACGIDRKSPMATSNEWRRVTCPECRRSPLAQITVAAREAEKDAAPAHQCEEWQMREGGPNGDRYCGACGRRERNAADQRAAVPVNRHDAGPRFKHDCDVCIFLGCETVGGTWHDLYFHPDDRVPTVLARESDEPGDYRSGLDFVDCDGALALAYVRAQRRGLL
jgi:hypothetical protein